MDSLYSSFTVLSIRFNHTIASVSRLISVIVSTNQRKELTKSQKIIADSRIQPPKLLTNSPFSRRLPRFFTSLLRYLFKLIWHERNQDHNSQVAVLSFVFERAEMQTEILQTVLCRWHWATDNANLFSMLQHLKMKHRVSLDPLGVGFCSSVLCWSQQQPLRPQVIRARIVVGNSLILDNGVI